MFRFSEEGFLMFIGLVCLFASFVVGYIAVKNFMNKDFNTKNYLVNFRLIIGLYKMFFLLK